MTKQQYVESIPRTLESLLWKQKKLGKRSTINIAEWRNKGK